MRIMNDNMENNAQALSQRGKEIRAFVEQYKGVMINSPIDAAPYILNISFQALKVKY